MPEKRTPQTTDTREQFLRAVDHIEGLVLPFFGPRG